MLIFVLRLFNNLISIIIEFFFLPIRYFNKHSVFLSSLHYFLNIFFFFLLVFLGKVLLSSLSLLMSNSYEFFELYSIPNTDIFPGIYLFIGYLEQFLDCIYIFIGKLCTYILWDIKLFKNFFNIDS